VDEPGVEEVGRHRRLTRLVRRLTVDVAPLRASRDFRVLWFGELVSQIGSQITIVALFVQVYALTHSSAAVGLIGLVQLVPMLVVSIGLGPQIDRRDRRRLLIVAQCGLMTASLMLLGGAISGNPPLVLVYSAAALNAGFVAISMPTRAAMTPNLVPANLLASSAALNQVMWNGAAVIGPAMGGIIVAQVGLSWAYGIDVASYAVAIGAALLIHAQRPHGQIAGDSGWQAIKNGLQFLKGKRVLQSTFTIDLVAMIFGMPRVLFPQLAAQQFHRGPEVVGWLFSAVAFGALVGALGSGWVRGIRRHGLAILLAVTVWGAAITAFGLSGDRLALALLFLAVAGGADVISAVFRSTVQQLVVPDALRGRLLAFNILVVAGGPRVGDLEAGVVASVFTPTISVVSGGLLCLAGVAVIASAVPRFARWHVGDPP
jgi:MFS family permease